MGAIRIAGLCVALLTAFPPAVGLAQQGDVAGEHQIEEVQWDLIESRKQLFQHEQIELNPVPEPIYDPPVMMETSEPDLRWKAPRAPPQSSAQLTNEKKYPDYKLTGVFQLDSAYFSQSENNLATLGDIEDGTGFRRARLAAVGNLTERVSYTFEVDFAQAQARFVDLWAQVDDTPFGNLRIGRYRQPFGMTEMTSVRELSFLERPTVFALAPFRQTGIMLFDTAIDENLTWAVSGFRGISDNFGNVYGDNGGYGTAERITFLPFQDGDSRLVHLGLGHSFIDPARDQLLYASQNGVFVGQNPNLGPSGLSVLPLVNVPPFVNSGVFDVDHVQLYNVEGGAAWGSAAWQAEYRWSDIQAPTGERALVHGGYMELRYVLTGEAIPYNRKAGVFGRVQPHCPVDFAKGHFGAWELAARISTIDLNPLLDLPDAPGPGRRLTSFDAGLNWYLWNYAKLQFNWLNGHLNDRTFGNSVSNTYAARLQVDF